MDHAPQRVPVPGTDGYLSYEFNLRHFEDDPEEASKMLYVLTEVFQKLAPPSAADSMSELYQKHLACTMLESLSSMVDRLAIPSPARFLQFLYQDLTGSDTIRILSFEEGKVLRCRLREVPLRSGERVNRYRAVSYVWGPAQPRRIVICNGVSIPVTPNLYDALVELRTLGTAANWWIDAICIYPHQTIMKYLGTLRFPPQFLEGFHSSELGILS